MSGMSILEFINKVMENDNLLIPLDNMVQALANEYLHRKVAYAFSHTRMKKKDREALQTSSDTLRELWNFVGQVRDSIDKETTESGDSKAKDMLKDVIARQEITTFIKNMDKKKSVFLLAPFSNLDEDEIEYILARIQQPLETFFKIKNTPIS